MFNSIDSNDNSFQIDENIIDFSFDSNEPQEITEEDKKTNTPTGVDTEQKDSEEEPFDDSVFNFDGDEDKDESEDDSEDSEDEDTSDSEDESDDEEDKPKKKTSTGPKSGILKTFNLLKDKGILDFDDEDELTEDNASEIIEDSFDRAVDNKVGEILGDLDDSRKNLIKYIANGGDVSKLSQLNVSDTTIDISEEKGQIKLLKQSLKDSDFGDDDEIEAQIQFYKDRGTLEKQAKKIFDKKEKKRKEEESAILRSQAEEREKAKVKAREFKKRLSKTLEENPELNDFTFTRKDKDLPDYINDATIKLEDGRSMSPFYKDLYGAMQDPKKLVVLAKIIRSDFDFSNLKNNTVTKQTKSVKDNIERQKDNKSSKKSSQKRLIDYLD